MGASVFDIQSSLPGGSKSNTFQKDADGNIIEDVSPFDIDNTDATITSLQSSGGDTDARLQASGANNFGGKKTLYGEYIGDAFDHVVQGEYGLPVYNKDTDKTPKIQPDNVTDTVPSLMNGYAVIRHAACGDKKNTNILNWKDLSGEQGAFPKYQSSSPNNPGTTGGRNLTIESILSDFKTDVKDSPYYPTPYYVSDFLYAKYFEYIPLNRLITLRRFPHPTWDNLEWPRDKSYPYSKGDQGTRRSFKPIAQAITYFGEPTGNKIEDLTKIKGNINWKQLEAEVNTYKGEMVAGLSQAPFAGKMGKFGRVASILTGKSDVSGRESEERDYAAAYTTEDYLRKPYGPVNSIVKTYIRDRGLEGNMKFTLTFEYQLRSYAGINPRLAMMDVYCNMLALLFHNANFWGGANRYFPNHPQYAFLGDQKKYFEGDYAGFLESFSQDIGKAAMSGLDILKNVMSSIMNMDFVGALKKMVKSIGGTVLDQESAKGRPHMIGFKALLKGDPVGDWHLTVGNPYRPIMRIGNLIMKDFDFSMSGHMSVDDIPSEMKWVVNLEQGMPRDKMGLESIFNYGQGKMYYKPIEGDIPFPTDGSGNKSSIQNTSSTSDNPGFIPKLSRLKPADADFVQKLAGTLY